MTVSSTNIISGPYTGNGASDQYSYTFRVEDKTQLKVYETTDLGVRTLLTVDTDYTVAGIGVDGGGVITRVAGNLPNNYTWYIRANYKATQTTAFGSQGPFLPAIHEAAMDKRAYVDQQHEDLFARTFKLSEEIDIDGDFEIDLNAANRSGKFLSFDTSGDLQATGGPQLVTADAIFDNVALMKASSLGTGLTVITRGYYAAGDGGGAQYLTVAPQAFDGYGDHQLTSLNIAVLQFIGSDVLAAKFGVKGDGGDYTSELQAAIDFTEARGGGILRLPVGIILVSSTLVNDDHNVHMIGHGSVGYTAATDWRNFAGTTIRWDGAAGGTVLQFKTPVSATRVLQNSDISGVLIDCDGTNQAAIGLEALALLGGTFNDVTVYRPSSKAYNLDIGAGLSSLVDTNTIQRTVFINCLAYCITAAASSAHGWVLGDTNVDTGTGNISMCSFVHCESLTYNGVGLKMHGSDSNTFHFFRAFVHASGTGYGIEFHGGSVANKRARGNMFFGYMGNGNVRSVTGTVEADGNCFFGYSQENGAALPVEVSDTKPIPYFTDDFDAKMKSVIFQAATPYVEWRETGVTADNGKWQVKADAEQLLITALTDAGSGGAKRISIDRTAQAIDAVNLEGAVDINIGGDLAVTGNAGFYGTTPAAKPTITGSRAGNAALASLLTALAGQGLITDSTTA